MTIKNASLTPNKNPKKNAKTIHRSLLTWLFHSCLTTVHEPLNGLRKTLYLMARLTEKVTQEPRKSFAQSKLRDNQRMEKIIRWWTFLLLSTISTLLSAQLFNAHSIIQINLKPFSHIFIQLMEQFPYRIFCLPRRFFFVFLSLYEIKFSSSSSNVLMMH